MVVTAAPYAPLYAAHSPYDFTVITEIPYGETVLYIASVDKGYCVGYESFIGYIEEGNAVKVTGYGYDFRLPSGDAYKYAVSGGAYYDGSDSWYEEIPEYELPEYTYPEHQVQPPAETYVNGILSYPFDPITAYPEQAIATRSGPGTKYVSTGTFSSALDYTVHYQTKGGSVNWGYVEFTYRSERYRLYTGVQRFTTDTELVYADEPYTYVDINTTHHVYYGPGYEYAQCSVDDVRKGKTVKAFYIENGWVMIEYSLTNGTLHRGWVPPGYWE